MPASGRACVAAGVLPDLFPAAAGLLASQGEDAGCAGDRPSHAGQFEALSDDRLAPGFDGVFILRLQVRSFQFVWGCGI